MYNNININKDEKIEDIDKEDLLTYFGIEGISSRNSNKQKYKKNLKTLKAKNQKSLSEIKKYLFPINNIKQKFHNNCILNEMLEKSLIINNKNNITNKSNKLSNEIKNPKYNKFRIKNIFIHSLKKDNSINKNIANYQSIYKIQNNNLSYLFDKSSRDFSDNFKSAKNVYNDLIRRKKILFEKFKNPKNKQDKDTQTISNIKENNSDNINNINNCRNKFEKAYVTNYLNRKKVNDIPLTFPLCFFHKINYNTISEKNRIENILNKFICLKTHIINDPSNAHEIIKEFIFKNSNSYKGELSEEKIENFLNYLKLTIRISPNKNIKEIINDALNFKDSNKYIKKIKINPKAYMRNDFKYNIIDNSTENNIKIINQNKQILPTFQSFYVNTKAFADFNSKSFIIKNKKLTSLVKDLENELSEIKNYQLVKYNLINNNSKNIKNKCTKNTLQNKEEKSKDLNMSNICLVSKGISQKYKLLYNYSYNNSKVEPKKISLKKLNERMYYNSLRRNLSEEYEIDEIKKKLKLTEYIVLQRAKQAFLFQNGHNAH